ncbi:MAG: ABC transporter permease [Gemmatimonadota bacterium]|nr:MAG: ABC transporter permease [Gemmatimonadota bacterium]
MPGQSELVLGRTADGALLIRLAGAWRLSGGLPDTAPVERELAATPAPREVNFETSELEEWDSALVTFLLRVTERSRGRGIDVDRSGLPAGAQRLLTLAEAVAEKEDARAAQADASLLERIGSRTISAGTSLTEMLAFLGDATLTFGRLLGGGVRFRRSDLLLLIQQVGAEALGIVSLICFLVGLILAFVGAAQLQQFGATIYVANLVGVAMVRDVGALMAAIVMAGRSGAAFAAELGSMKVTQEIDALTTMGISPLEFLVVPRIVALASMMPLLCLYADFLGILGGAFIGITMLDLSVVTYAQQTIEAVTLGHLLGGMFKAFVYGILIALAGCLRGLQATTSSSGVGIATTSAVVTSIVFVISACGLFAVVFYALGL